MSAAPVPDVEQRDRRAAFGRPAGQALERSPAQLDATEAAVDPGQVAQVAGQGSRVVERPVEQLRGVREARHRSSWRGRGA